MDIVAPDDVASTSTLFIIFVTADGTILVPSDNRFDEYENVLNFVASRNVINALRAYDVGTCVRVSPNILCVIDRRTGETESRIKPRALVDLLKILKESYPRTVMFLPKLRKHYIKNGKYTTMLLNENVHILFV